jgi:hypothetical protein
MSRAFREKCVGNSTFASRIFWYVPASTVATPRQKSFECQMMKTKKERKKGSTKLGGYSTATQEEDQSTTESTTFLLTEGVVVVERGVARQHLEDEHPQRPPVRSGTS